MSTFSLSADSEFGRDLIKRGLVYICVGSDREVDLPEDQGIELFDPYTIDDRLKEVGPEGLPDSFYLEEYGLGTAWFRKASLTDLETVLEEAAARREALDAA